MPGIIAVTVPAASTWLTTLADAKDEIGITGSANDIRLGKLIDRASSAITGYCGRTFGVQTITETVRRPCYVRNVGPYGSQLGTHHKPLILGQQPVASIASITVNGTALDPTADYEADLGAGLAYRLFNGLRGAWDTGTIVLVYAAGYTLPNDPAPATPIDTLPAVVSDACLSLVRSAWFSQGRDPNVAMDMLDGDRTQFWDRSLSPMAIDADMASNLADFRDRVW